MSWSWPAWPILFHLTLLLWVYQLMAPTHGIHGFIQDNVVAIILIRAGLLSSLQQYQVYTGRYYT